MRERLQSKPNEILSKHVLIPMLRDDCLHSFEAIIQVNEAHILMLLEQGLLAEESARELLLAFAALRAEGPAGLEMEADYEDLYFNVEQYIMKIAGRNTGGKMHISRSRNDLNATLTRMKARDELRKTCGIFNELRSKLVGIAEEHLSTIFTAYTHSQPAQPISLAHYFLALVKAFERDYERLRQAYEHLNLSPLGSGALAGTSFAIDRDYTARLLGFAGVIENSLDGVAARDYLLEIMAAYAILASNVNRFSYDLYTWSSYEHAYIEFDDSLASCSSIMPQKKNPTALEHIKSRTAHMASAFADLNSCLRNIPYSHCRDIGSELTLTFWDASDQIGQALELLSASLSGMSINRERMEEAANTNFSTVTELANELVRQLALPFRTAHAVVGQVVQICVNNGLGMAGVTVDLLNEKLLQQNAPPLPWTAQYLAELLNARNVVAKHQSQGGPGHKACAAMLTGAKARLSRDVCWLAEAEHRQEQAAGLRKERIEEILKREWGVKNGYYPAQAGSCPVLPNHRTHEGTD